MDKQREALKKGRSQSSPLLRIVVAWVIVLPLVSAILGVSLRLSYEMLLWGWDLLGMAS